MSVDNAGYDALVAKEKQFFSGEAPETSIPAIFTYWASRYLSPRLNAMFGTPVIEAVFANEVLRVFEQGQRAPIRLLSLGSGECSLELAIARLLSERGVEFQFACTDISPAMLAAGGNLIKRAGLAAQFELIECDVNSDLPSREFDFVIANHCLHHFVNLEYIFGWVSQVLDASRGAFIVSDMIGRNGHMRWPEALAYVEKVWAILPEAKKFDCIHRVSREQYLNFDCAEATLEGVRAQDILPLMLERFYFERFVGYGNIPDVFVDRMYGPNFSVDNPQDVAFIDLLEQLNQDLTLAGIIKPTMMFATVRRHAVESRYDPLPAERAARLPS